MRTDKRKNRELRPVEITPGYNRYAEGSCLIKTGNTVVLCCASLDDFVPPHCKGTGRGWISAEYSMLPRAGLTRSPRESSRGKIKGRTHEIQRLIGRSLRAVVDLASLREKHIMVDCDVLQADGGTRTASVTGGFVALVLALRNLERKKIIETIPVTHYVAATSVGLCDGQVLLDLDYGEDSSAQVDLNLVMTDRAEMVEVQATGEESVFTAVDLETMINYGRYGIAQLIRRQQKVLGRL